MRLSGAAAARATRRQQQPRSVGRHGDRRSDSQTARVLDALARTQLGRIRICTRAGARHGESGRVEIVREHRVLLALGVAQLLLRWLRWLRRLYTGGGGDCGNGAIGQQAVVLVVICRAIAAVRETRRGREQRRPQIIGTSGSSRTSASTSGSNSTSGRTSASGSGGRRRDACGVHGGRLSDQQRDQLLLAQTRAQVSDGLGAREMRRQRVLRESREKHREAKNYENCENATEV